MHPIIFRYVALALVACALLAPAPAAAATLGCDAPTAATTDLDAWSAEMLTATNAHRATLGLVALQLDATLTKASAWKSHDLARRNYFAHDDKAEGAAPSRSPWQRLTDCGWTGSGSRAENIAAGQSSGARFITAWLNSPGHRANIENPSMRFVGFGIARSTSSTYGTYATQMLSSIAGPVATTTPPPATTTPPAGGTETGDDPRTPYGLDGLPAAKLQALTARITSQRCRSRLAVAGRCWRVTTRGVLRTADGAAIAGQRLTLTRRAAGGRWVSIGAVRTTATGAFTHVRTLAPTTRSVRAWLARNAGAVRISAPVTSVSAATTRQVATRLP